MDWIGRTWPTAEDFAVGLAFRGEAPELSVEAVDVQSTTLLALPHKPGRSADDLTGKMVRLFIVQPPASHRVDDFIVDGIVGGEPHFVWY